MQELLNITLWVKKGLRRRTVYVVLLSISHRVLTLLDIEVVDVLSARVRVFENGVVRVVPLEVDKTFRVRKFEGLSGVDNVKSEGYVSFVARFNTSEVNGLIVLKPKQMKMERRVGGDIDIQLTASPEVVSEIEKVLDRINLLRKRIVKWYAERGLCKVER